MKWQKDVLVRMMVASAYINRKVLLAVTNTGMLRTDPIKTMT